MKTRGILCVTAFISILLFGSSCEKQTIPANLAEPFIQISHSVEPFQEEDENATIIVKVNCFAEAHPEYDKNIDDYASDSYWDITYSHKNQSATELDKKVKLPIQYGLSPEYSIEVEVVRGDASSINIYGKFELAYSKGLKRAYIVGKEDNLPVPEAPTPEPEEKPE